MPATFVSSCLARAQTCLVRSYDRWLAFPLLDWLLGPILGALILSLRPLLDILSSATRQGLYIIFLCVPLSLTLAISLATITRARTFRIKRATFLLLLTYLVFFAILVFLTFLVFLLPPLDIGTSPLWRAFTIVMTSTLALRTFRYNISFRHRFDSRPDSALPPDIPYQ